MTHEGMSDDCDHEATLEIAIPTYNGGATIVAAIDSLLASIGDATEVKIKVYDNASTDDTVERIRELQASHSNIEISESKVNVGFDGNIERCLLGAQSKYLWFFSDDDVAASNALSCIADVLNKKRPLIINISQFSFRSEAPSWTLFNRNRSDDEVYFNGWDFLDDHLRSVGLISSLVVNVEAARKYIVAIDHGPARAHLDISVRIALREVGCYVKLNRTAIAARAAVKYDSLKLVPISLAKLFETLHAGNYISKRRVKAWMRIYVFPELIKGIIKGRSKRRQDLEAILSEVVSLGKVDPFRWRLVLVANTIPSLICQYIEAAHSMLGKLR